MRSRVFLTFCLVFALGFPPFLRAHEPPPELSPLTVRGCANQLVWFVLGAAVVGTGIYWGQPPRPVPPTPFVLVKSAGSSYSPLQSREEKSLALFEAAYLDSGRGNQGGTYEWTVQEIQRTGIRLPDALQPVPPVRPRHPLVAWVATHDPDSQVRWLATRLERFSRFSREERVQLAREYLGDSVPGYRPGAPSTENFRALLTAAQAGFSPSQRLGLAVVEYGEGFETKEGLRISSEIGLVARYLRLVPGLLEGSARNFSPLDAQQWFAHASATISENDAGLIEKMASVHRGCTGVDFADRALFHRVGAKAWSIWLKPEHSFLNQRLARLLEENTSYYSELAAGLEHASAGVVLQSLHVAGLSDSKCLQAVRARILACLAHPDPKVRLLAAQVACEGGLFSSAGLIAYVENLPRSVDEIAFALRTVSRMRDMLSTDEAKAMDLLLSKIEREFPASSALQPVVRSVRRHLQGRE